MSLLSNAKVRTKLFGGFGLMTVILTTLGVTGYVMFSRINTNVNGLTDHSLAAVKNATGVERAALETLLQEKEYLIGMKDEANQQTKKKLAELTAYLDAVDAVASRFNDTNLANKSKDVRAIVTQYGKLYDEGVAALKSNKAGEAAMNEKGGLVNDEATAYLASKKAEYLEAKESLAIVNRIAALAWETRWARQKYIHEQNDSQAEMVEKHCQTLNGCYDELDKMHPDVQEQKLIATARKATVAYSEDSKRYVEAVKQNASAETLAANNKRTAMAGLKVSDAAETYLKSKEAAVNKIAESVFIVADIANEANTTRLNEKAYILTQDSKYWVALNEHITKLSRLYNDLRKVSLTDADRQRIERAEKATSEYLVAAKSWVDNDNKVQKTILPEMNKSGDKVVLTAQNAEDDAWQASGEAANTVASIVGSSKTIIVISLMVGVALACIAAWTITQAITRPLAYVVQQLHQVAGGNLKNAIADEHLQRKDEIGDLANSLDKTVRSLRTMVSEITNNTETLAGSSSELSATASQLASGAEEATNQSATVAAAAEQMSTNMNVMAASTEQMSSNVRIVASSVEELTASIAEVAKSAEQAASVAATAAQLTKSGNDKIGELGTAAGEIGKVIEVIQDIAE
ncbi:MAG: methyl-accepting chemotaxis protein, partial [Thermoguttaceae bacterium]